MTKTELQEALDAAGIEYPKNATKAKLMALMPPEAKSPDQLTEEALAEATEQQESPTEEKPAAQPKPKPGVEDDPIITVRTARHGKKTGRKSEIEAWRKSLGKKK